VGEEASAIKITSCEAYRKAASAEQPRLSEIPAISDESEWAVVRVTTAGNAYEPGTGRRSSAPSGCVAVSLSGPRAYEFALEKARAGRLQQPQQSLQDRHFRAPHAVIHPDVMKSRG
jgi:hypothetical protein